MFFWRLLVVLSWVSYTLSIYMFYDDGENIWVIFSWATALLSSAALMIYFFGGAKKLAVERQLIGADYVFPLVTILPGLLVFPTVLLL